MDERAKVTDRAALVVNPVKVRSVAALSASVRAASARAGWADPLILETTVTDPGQAAAAEALAAGATSVLVAGGDGTVRAVAEAMRGSGVPLAIVPSGTGNLLARNLRLPLDRVGPMVEAAFSGDALAVDIGVATLTRADGARESHAFVVMAGMGLDAAMIAHTNPRMKRQLGWVAYVDGAARSLPRAAPFRMAYQFDGHGLHSAKAYSVLFANCGALPAGIDLVPGARVDDGLLDVALIQPTGLFGWLGVWRKLWWDNSVLRRTRLGRRVVARTRNQSIRYLSGTGVEAGAPEPVPVELDGDEFGRAARIRCEIDRGGLVVAVPAGHSLATATRS
ncbi:diacylglycerol/lipid kinase family protein [Microbacterium excoecariae]|uniref:diacylglycerol/lipid kinase family protein n=1 Tax=Microbacterium excoecariae TaxID=2715210 RepID=UPI0014089FBF|nr:diacylglycerol kinase family protein [Microbacterium excoecariae]NHI16233.1 sphingosine kinase [Microbacterium excoecariae]